jgi:hypothetical protein
MKNKTAGVYETPKPQAWIAISSSRQKIYGDKSVYLDNGQEFQIELYNPTNQPYLAKIYLNGKIISSSGLVLRPGQRYFLDRFIDVSKKLVFSTYEVDDNPEVKQAIANNGMIKVEFYPEQFPLNWGTITTTQWPPYRQTFTWCGGTTFSNSTGSLNFSSGAVSTTSAYYSNSTENSFSYLNESKSLETGRVEQGSKSNQEFSNSNGNFSWIWTYSSEYQILPRSVKPVEVSEIRDYCTECGSRVKKKTWKFCPSCGEKVN